MTQYAPRGKFTTYLPAVTAVARWRQKDCSYPGKYSSCVADIWRAAALAGRTSVFLTERRPKPPLIVEPAGASLDSDNRRRGDTCGLPLAWCRSLWFANHFCSNCRCPVNACVINCKAVASSPRPRLRRRLTGISESRFIPGRMYSP